MIGLAQPWSSKNGHVAHFHSAAQVSHIYFGWRIKKLENAVGTGLKVKRERSEGFL